MTFLVLSTSALGLAPLLGWLLRSSAMGLHMLDGFVLVSILGVCLVHMLPEALAVAGPFAAITLALGFMAPSLVEQVLVDSGRKTHLAVLVFAAAGLLVHAFLDGAALAGVSEHLEHADHLGHQAMSNGSAGVAMAWGILLHRIPVSLMIWWAFRPLHGTAAAAAVLLGLAGSTVAGFSAAKGVVHLFEGALAGHVLALVAGSILHVVLHQTGPEGFSGKHHPCPHWAGAGATLALGLLVWSAGQGGPAQEGTIRAFFEFFLESAPALVIGFLFAGFVQEFLPEAGVQWLTRGGNFLQSLKGMAFGLPLPICSCGVVPVYKSLVDRGAPVAAAVAFLVATPEVGIDAVLLSMPLLGFKLTAVRVGAAMVVALASGVILGWLAPHIATATLRPEEDPEMDACCASSCEESTVLDTNNQSFAKRFRGAIRYGAVDLVDHTGPWILLGLMIAAILEPALNIQGLTELPTLAQVLIMTLIGMPMYVCAAGATPVAAVLLSKGLAPGAAIAFLLAGPVTNATTFGVLRTLHGKRMASVFVLVLLVACVTIGVSISGLPADWTVATGKAAGLHESHGLIHWVCAGAMALLFAGAVFRQGPRGLAEQVIASSHTHDHGSCGDSSEAELAEEEDLECGHSHSAGHGH